MMLLPWQNNRNKSSFSSVLCPWLSVLWLSSVILLRVSNRKKASLFVWVSGGASRIKRETKELKENNPIFLLISFLQKLPKFERSEIRGTLLGFWFIAHSALLSGHLPRCQSRSGLKSLKWKIQFWKFEIYFGESNTGKISKIFYF